MTNFTFAIPFRGRQTTSDWSKVCRLLQSTLRSALNQNGADVAILVAGHDKPDIEEMSHPAVTFIQASWPQPDTHEAQMRDKRKKKILLYQEFKKQGGGYIMLLDADDLVSNQLASYVLKDGDKNGYIIDDGYRYYSKTCKIERAQGYLDHICGSCAVLYYEPGELPDKPEEFTPDNVIGMGSHADFRKMSEQQNKTLKPVPFPAVIYIVGHGENHSTHESNISNISQKNYMLRVKKLANLVIPERRKPEVRREFGLDT